MCTGRVDLSFILHAFAKGADGVLIGGCWPGECHYVTEGNYDALANMHLCKKLLLHLGLESERLRLEWVAASEGARFAEVMNDFVDQLKELGKLGAQRPTGAEMGGTALPDRDPKNGKLGSGDVAREVLQRRLDAAKKLVPYMKLVERERLRAPERTEEAYNAYYQSDEVERLFQKLIAEKLMTSQILQILSDGALTTKEIAEKLGLEPSLVSKHMNSTSRQSLVAYDMEQNRYALIEGVA